MAITVQTIEEKEFKTKVRGYDPVEVDEFLDDICDEMIAMQEEIGSLQTRLAQSSGRAGQSFAPSPVPAPLSPIAPPAQSESESMKLMLQNTQRVCDETIEQAKKQADEIIAQARAKAQDMEGAALIGQRDKLRQEIETLKDAANSYRDRFNELVDKQRAVFDEITFE